MIRVIPFEKMKLTLLSFRSKAEPTSREIAESVTGLLYSRGGNLAIEEKVFLKQMLIDNPRRAARRVDDDLLNVRHSARQRGDLIGVL